MKYGESIFDIAYLLFAIISGSLILYRAKVGVEKLMGWAALILGVGDAFHLLPRVMVYYVPGDMSFYLGIGKFVTSITVTIFYVLLFYIWMYKYNKEKNQRDIILVWVLAAIRIVICLFPQNGWTGNGGSITWAVLRNLPFVLMGAYICLLYYQDRDRDRIFRYFWLYILFSFLFYLPVTVGTGIMPALGMLMLPKTVCYILMIWSFLLTQRSNINRDQI